MDYTIIGAEVNLAERLESAADQGGILIGHETYSLVKAYISAEEQEPKGVKGIAKPVRNYKVIGRQQKSNNRSNHLAVNLGGVDIVLNTEEMSAPELQKLVKTLEEIMQHIKAGFSANNMD